MENKNIDPRWLFINLGYNLRPTEIQAAFGLEQIKRLNTMNTIRCENVKKLRKSFKKNLFWKDQLLFPEATKDIDPCWFGFPFLLSKELGINLSELTKNLSSSGVDTRPIISGNMAIQPALRLFNVDLSIGPYLGAQEIHERGLFIGCHSKPLENNEIAQLVKTVLGEIEKLS